MDTTEIKTQIDALGQAHAAWTAEYEAKQKRADAVREEKLARMEKAIDDAVEAKAKLEAALKAEQKEREELEIRLNRRGAASGSGDPIEAEVKAFNRLIKSNAASRGLPAAPVDRAGYEDYKAAFDRWVRSPDTALTVEERKTLSVGSDPDGGYYVPPDISGRIVKKVYETSPIRQIAFEQTISSDALEGIEDTGEAGAGYAGETAQGSDTTTPQIGKWRIQPYWIDTEPKATQQLLDDASVDIEGWLSDKVATRIARFENSEFINGASMKIRGFVKGYTPASDSGSGVTWGQPGYWPTGVSGDFAASNPSDNLLDLVGLLKNYYLNNANFVTRRSVITKIRKFKDSTGQFLWQPSLQAGQPEMLLGYPIVRCEDMPAIAASSYSIAFGDFREAYQIVDRIGIRVLRDPFTAKPYVKFYTTKRTGGGVVNYEAFKLMKFAVS